MTMRNDTQALAIALAISAAALAPANAQAPTVNPVILMNSRLEVVIVASADSSREYQGPKCPQGRSGILSMLTCVLFDAKSGAGTACPRYLQ